MLIAIDFDLTYTADPILFNEFIGFAKFRGHEVVICTTRNADQDNTHTLVYLSKTVPVYFMDGLPKKEFMKETFGKDVDIWIDDKPESVINGSSTDREALAKWRQEQHGILHPQLLLKGYKI